MINEHEHINIQFEKSGREISNRFFNDFQRAVKEIDRTNNEYLFQQLKNQYVNTLKADLQATALELLQHNQANHEIKGIDQHLNQLVRTELHQFVQKLNNL